MGVQTAISDDMVNALTDWYDMYANKASWLSEEYMRSLNLPAFICSEIARSVTLEMKWNITGKEKDGSTQDADGNVIMNPRAEFLKKEFERCIKPLRTKLEQGLAAGGMSIKPYPRDGHIYFDWTMDWSLHPVAFDGDGNLSDVIFKNSYTEGKTIYTRLERHKVEGQSVIITHKAFKSNIAEHIGTEISLAEVAAWVDLEPEVKIVNSEGSVFGWFRVASANNIDVESPMGISVFHQARDSIHDADEQYSRLMWEFEGSELAVDVDPTALRPRPGGGMGMPRLNKRLFRGVDLGNDENYHVFSPNIRDVSLINGMDQILTRVEDLSGLSRGTLTAVPAEARTATELRILRQRSYATVHDNQTALEACLRDVIRAMDKYATLYNLAPEGEYDVSFEWDDSVITDTEQQLNERMMLYNAGLYGGIEFRKWYFGETSAQAKAAISAVMDEKKESMKALQELEPTIPLED